MLEFEKRHRYIARHTASVDPIIDLLSLIISRAFQLISIHLFVSVDINCYD
jgi:hypothetical protein